MLRWLIKAAFYVGGALLLIGGILRAFFAQPLEISHGGMAPTLALGDVVLLWKGEPEVGDVAVCKHPEQPGLVVVGRLVATSGEVSVREDGIETVNGTTPTVDWKGSVELPDAGGDLTQFGIAEARYGDSSFGHTHRFMAIRREVSARQRRRERRYNRASREPRSRNYRLEPGRWFLLSDNRAAPEHDSRSFGGVEPSACLGTIVMRLETTPEGESSFGHGWLDPIE